MRLFIAIDLPNFVKEHLRNLQKLLPNGKFSLTHDFHLTLKFLGSCHDHRRKRVETALRKISFSPFEASLTTMGTFGGSRPRVIWVGVNVPVWLKQTAYDIEEQMVRLGFEKEHRFIPHITLARVKNLENPEKFLQDLKKITVDPLKFSVTHFSLFESRLSRGGAVHTELAQFSP